MSVSNILPRTSRPDVAQLTVCSAVFDASGGSENGQRANLSHVGRRQTLAHRFSAHVPAFCTFVGDVVVVRSEEQMVWIDACPDITAMENVHSVRDCSVPNFPRPPMHDLLTPLEHKTTVAALVKMPGPKDTVTVRRSPGIERQSFGERRLARRHDPSILAHSPTRPSPAIGGQGWVSRVNATRPAFHSTSGVP